jgi:hypothetical protein
MEAFQKKKKPAEAGINVAPAFSAGASSLFRAA